MTYRLPRSTGIREDPGLLCDWQKYIPSAAWETAKPTPLETAPLRIAPAFCTVSVNQQDHVPAGLLEVGRVGVTIQSQLGVGSVSPREVGGKVPHPTVNGLPAKEAGGYHKVLRGSGWW